jgi:hypothetical protein
MPLPAEVPPVPSVEAEPEPEPPAEEPPVPSVVLDEPLPAVEPPAPIVELDCACANAIPAATIVEASAAVRRSLSAMLYPPHERFGRRRPLKCIESKLRDAPSQRGHGRAVP